MARVSERENKRSFVYQRRTKEDIKEQANRRGGSYDSFIKPQYKLYKVRDGKNLIRILPPTWPKARHYGYDIWVNYSIGVDNQSYLSLGKMMNKPDPLAEARRAAEQEGNEKLAKDLQPRERVLMWLIDRSEEDEGPQLWPAPFTFNKALANISFDEDTKEVIYIDDPEVGCDVRFYKEGTGLNTRYDASKMRLLKPSPIHEDEGVQQEWLDFVAANPVPDCLQFYEYEHIAGVFNGQARVERDDEADERPAPTVTRQAEPEDDDDKADERPAPQARLSRDEDERDERLQRGRSRLSGNSEGEERADERPTESIREQLRRRRGATSPKDDDED